MGEPRPTRIQLCGWLVVEPDGRRVEDALPGTKGRLLFAYLVLNRDRRMSRDQVWICAGGASFLTRSGAGAGGKTGAAREGLGWSPPCAAIAAARRP